MTNPTSRLTVDPPMLLCEGLNRESCFVRFSACTNPGPLCKLDCALLLGLCPRSSTLWRVRTSVVKYEASYIYVPRTLTLTPTLNLMRMQPSTLTQVTKQSPDSANKEQAAVTSGFHKLPVITTADSCLVGIPTTTTMTTRTTSASATPTIPLHASPYPTL